MTKLHEVLAVEADKEGVAKTVIAETEKNFQNNHTLFQGMEKVLSMQAEGQETVEEAGYESRTMETTVPRRLAYTAEAITDWLDVVLQKECTNQQASGEIVLEGLSLTEPLPVTFLLGMETKLKHLRKMYLAIPTLPPGMRWEASPQDGDDVFRLTDPEVRIKTAKQIMYKTVAQATDKHPAQVETWNEDVPVGKFTTTYKAGMISSSRKHTLLGRLDKLIQAVKQARMRANSRDIVDRKIGKEIFDYLHED